MWSSDSMKINGEVTMKWIKCSQQMPEIGERIIGYNKENNLVTKMFYGSYTEKLIGGEVPTKITFYSDEDCCGRYEYENVTHWMPLPPLPLPNDFCSTCELEIAKSISLGKEYDAFNCCGNKVCKSSQSLHECRCVGE